MPTYFKWYHTFIIGQKRHCAWTIILSILWSSGILISCIEHLFIPNFNVYDIWYSARQIKNDLSKCYKKVLFVLQLLAHIVII